MAPIAAASRVKPDGSLDETFINFNSGANGRVSALALQADGKVIAGGFFSIVNDAVRGGIARLITNLAPNPIDTAANLVIQHYRDFLSREADPEGLAFWTGQITSCGADAQCVEVARINVCVILSRLNFNRLAIWWSGSTERLRR
jgi:hypothetical protein